MQETQLQSLGQEDPPEEGTYYSLQRSCLENSGDKGTWQAMVAKSQTPLSDSHTHTHLGSPCNCPSFKSQKPRGRWSTRSYPVHFPHLPDLVFYSPSHFPGFNHKLYCLMSLEDTRHAPPLHLHTISSLCLDLSSPGRLHVSAPHLLLSLLRCFPFIKDNSISLSNITNHLLLPALPHAALIFFSFPLLSSSSNLLDYSYLNTLIYY